MKDIEPRIAQHIDELIKRYPLLKECRRSIESAYSIMEKCYENDGKLLIAGNGGSAADSEHMTGELMKRFRIARPISEQLASKLRNIDCIKGDFLAKNLECSLMAISLVTHESFTTACMNDINALGVFAQQLLGYGRTGDVFFAISTSGNSENILYAVVVAKAIGLKVVALTGIDGGELAKMADVVIKVPEHETYKIQEFHLPIYHCLCLMLEDKFFGKVLGNK